MHAIDVVKSLGGHGVLNVRDGTWEDTVRGVNDGRRNMIVSVRGDCCVILNQLAAEVSPEISIKCLREGWLQGAPLLFPYGRDAPKVRASEKGHDSVRGYI